MTFEVKLNPLVIPAYKPLIGNGHHCPAQRKIPKRPTSSVSFWNFFFFMEILFLNVSVSIGSFSSALGGNYKYFFFHTHQICLYFNKFIYSYCGHTVNI